MKKSAVVILHNTFRKRSQASYAGQPILLVWILLVASNRNSTQTSSKEMGNLLAYVTLKLEVELVSGMTRT